MKLTKLFKKKTNTNVAVKLQTLNKTQLEKVIGGTDELQKNGSGIRDSIKQSV